MSESEAVIRAEQQLRAIVSKRDRAVARSEQLSDARKQIGFAVFADGDSKARKQLDALNAEGATLAGELEALEAAISEAQRRLELAKQAAAEIENKAQATKLRTVLESAAARAVEVDALFASAVTELGELFKDIRQFHQLGETFPTDEQWSVNTLLALKTILMQMPPSVARAFEFLAPNQRRTFASIMDHMAGPIEARVKQRLSETEQKAA
jgi:hypothetical protein